MPAVAGRFARALESGWTPWLALILVYGAAFAALAARGFALGFYSDVLAYHYHYHFDGIIGGMNWLVSEHWQRHLLGALFSAPLHALAPDRYDLWYALALAAHFAVGLTVFLLVDALQSGERRWLALGISLLFVFDPLQTPSTLGFATGTHRKAALLLALLALWAYLRFVRGRRRQLTWYSLNIACFGAALMIYEQSIFFFLLQPLIAWIEDRRLGALRASRSYAWLLARDAALHVAFAGVYIYLLLILFPGGNSNLVLRPEHILRQFADGLVLLFSPANYVGRLGAAAALSQSWLLILLALAVAGIFSSSLRFAPRTAAAAWTPGWLAVFGLLLTILNIAGTAPTHWVFRVHERLLYASSIGSAMLILGGLAWLHARHRRVGGALIVGYLVFTLATGVAFLYDQQAILREEDAASRRVIDAIVAAIPEFAPDAQPYLLLVSDADPQSELALHPGDVRFPYLFALRYGIRDFRADALLHDHAAKYPSMGSLKLTAAGIISPLDPYETIAYDRVIIVAYDSQSDSAQVLERIPEAALRDANIINQVGAVLETNWLLLPASRQ
ncbi:MAG: hypothetical protein OXE95_11475 [Chloroflexi bacterium]|nr:hypothetical protein [Chloroflexota bacterium]MCY4248178.1 hypothetical protein [Chloroflexota bacterium]